MSNYIINVRGYVSSKKPLMGGAFLNPFYSGSQFLSWLQIQLEQGAGAVLVSDIEFLNVTSLIDKDKPDPLHQEIIDLFAQNTGDYTPTEEEKDNIHKGVEHILKLARAGVTDI